ncbi:MAG: metallophosphoesterase [Phycisphaerae bacterium]|nr:metallophosphoesterase [Gemmatimonadaceae bacterium]
MQRRPFLKLLGITPLLGLANAPSTSNLVKIGGAARPDNPPAPPGAWSFVLLPDTQCYCESYPEVFMSQTEWIVRNRQARNIQFVLHLGDVTNNNVHPEWVNARRAMDVIKRADIPHLMVVGNHDLGPWGSGGARTSHFSDYFIQRNARVPGESENAFMTVTVGSSKFLIIGLEFGPRDVVVDWANEVVARFPDHHAILLTHAYVYSDGTRYDWKTKAASQTWNPNAYGIGTSPEEKKHGVNDGEALWQKLVGRHKQFAFTFNGHVLNDGIGHVMSQGVQGNTVHQMLVNYQCGVVPDRKNGGGGFLRIVEVQPDGVTLNISDYSPFYDQWLTDADRKFTIKLPRNLNLPVPV